MTRIQKIKNWSKAHQEELVFAGVVAFMVTASGALVYLQTKMEEEAAEGRKQLAQWTIEQNKLGKSVFQLADGSHIAVEMQ